MVEFQLSSAFKSVLETDINLCNCTCYAFLLTHILSSKIPGIMGGRLPILSLLLFKNVISCIVFLSDISYDTVGGTRIGPVAIETDHPVLGSSHCSRGLALGRKKKATEI